MNKQGQVDQVAKLYGRQIFLEVMAEKWCNQSRRLENGRAIL